MSDQKSSPPNNRVKSHQTGYPCFPNCKDSHREKSLFSGFAWLTKTISRAESTILDHHLVIRRHWPTIWPQGNLVLSFNISYRSSPATSENELSGVISLLPNSQQCNGLFQKGDPATPPCAFPVPLDDHVVRLQLVMQDDHRHRPRRGRFRYRRQVPRISATRQTRWTPALPARAAVGPTAPRYITNSITWLRVHAHAFRWLKGATCSLH